MIVYVAQRGCGGGHIVGVYQTRNAAGAAVAVPYTTHRVTEVPLDAFLWEEEKGWT